MFRRYLKKAEDAPDAVSKLLHMRQMLRDMKRKKELAQQAKPKNAVQVAIRRNSLIAAPPKRHVVVPVPGAGKAAADH